MVEVKEAPRAKTEVVKGRGAAAEAEAPPPKPARGDVGPLGFVRRMAEEMDRLFEDFGLPRPGFVGRPMLRREFGPLVAEWIPTIDIREAEGQLIVQADLPGLTKDDVKVELTGELLTIQGERKVEKKEERAGYAYSECRYGSFFRAIPLPEGVDTSKATAKFRDGVLEIAMPAPRRSVPQARRLEIQTKT
jgi:HSP20 family protein